MPLEAIVTRRLYQQVADRLRELVESGEYKVGDRLPPERELAEMLDVSRPTVREALIALEVEGRVRIRVGSGIYFTEPRRRDMPAVGEESPFELLQAREFIESAVAEEAARHVTPEHVARLDAVLDRMARQAHPTRTTLRIDRDFHTAVAEILGNAVIVRVIGELFDRRMNPFFERLSRYFENRATWEAAHAEHCAIRDAIAAGNPAAAGAAMRQHLQRSQERFSSSFGETSVAARAAEETRPPAPAQ